MIIFSSGPGHIHIDGVSHVREDFDKSEFIGTDLSFASFSVLLLSSRSAFYIETGILYFFIHYPDAGKIKANCKDL